MADLRSPFRYDFVGSFLRPQALKNARAQFKAGEIDRAALTEVENAQIKLLIEKDGSKETIEWNKLKLTDGSGTEYTRMSDEFLTDLGMTRMTGNTLNFGSNEGWIAFEIDENAENLELRYPFEAESYQQAL